jgi:hypothetical protein
LLVAFIPGLLMLAAFGLERLEAGLENDAITASDVTDFRRQAEPVDVRTLARDGMPEATCRHGRIGRITDEWAYLPSRAEPATDRLLTASFIPAAPVESGLAKRRRQDSRPNRQFGPREHANRV